MGTKNNPGKFDCYNAAEPDEPMFVLLGRDPTAAICVAFWIALRVELGETGAKIEEASACVETLVKWAIDHGKSEKFQRVLEILELPGKFPGVTLEKLIGMALHQHVIDSD